VGRKSDPRRLPRRNHYQEGPDFLFLATQGGRPPTPAQPASAAAVVRHRAGALRRWRDGETPTSLAAERGIGRATLYRWQARQAEGGLIGLVDPVHIGRASDLDPILERVILTVRLLTNWNSRRIAAELGRRGIGVSHGQIDRLFARFGTHRSSEPRVPGPRYERGSPNELWHRTRSPSSGRWPRRSSCAACHSRS
jgi:transposase